MKYTINKLAKMAGVSVRTLHYYDQIGLLKPSHIGENLYRYYEEKDLLRLQQVLFFRELEFKLDEIKQILDDTNFDMLQALSSHGEALKAERHRYDRMINTIENTIKKMTGEKGMKDEDLYEGLTKEQVQEYQEEARQRWGKDTVDQSVARVKSWSKEKLQSVKDEGGAIVNEIAEKMKAGVPPEDAEVRKLAGQYHRYMNNFYDCSLEIFEGLAKMYVADERFTANYEKIAPGLAQYVSGAMINYCKQSKEQKKPA
ncbi:MAG: MerR family transcriptional regulator [Patescibacteria group bacterium]|jgi:DNA-binding transcriptional MerR regulator